jgi:site-specific recombinase XerD
LSIVFTTPTGELVLRQPVAKLINQGAKTAGIAADLGTHAGRRSVMTTLFVDGDEALDQLVRRVDRSQ